MKAIKADGILPAGWLNLFSEHPRIGIGLDPATTTKKTSNPSSITVTQQVGLMYLARLIIRYKTADPDVTEAILRLILDGLRSRGLSVRRLCILATNERFFAVSIRKKFVSKVPVQLVIESEKTTYLGQQMLVKAYLGNLVVNTIEDGYLPLPPEEFVRTDMRLVVKDRGTFDSELGTDGGHGDTFASTGASLHALKTKGGPAEAAGAQVGTFGAKRPVDPGRKLVNPSAGGRGWRLAT